MKSVGLKLILATCLFLTTIVGGIHCGGAMVQQSAPPAQRTETPGPRPGINSVWVDGHWEFREGHYLWSPGRWVRARPDHRWVPGYWVYQAQKWRFFAGRWEKK